MRHDKLGAAATFSQNHNDQLITLLADLISKYLDSQLVIDRRVITSLSMYGNELNFECKKTIQYIPVSNEYQDIITHNQH